MALSKEFSRPVPETNPGFFPSDSRVSERKINIFPAEETGVKERIRKLYQIFFAESKKGGETETQPQRKTHQEDGFEPFVNPQPSGDTLFVNGYNGNFAQQMELNRKGIERMLKIAHLDGQVILTSLSPNRQRSIEANPDGSVTRKRSLFLGEKIEDEDKNPFRRVIPIPQGWKIEINSMGITEELEKRRLTGKKLQTEFIQQFNAQLNQGLLKCIVKEKLTEVKDKHLAGKLFLTLLPPTLQSMIAIFYFSSLNIVYAIELLVLTEMNYITFNIVGQLMPPKSRKIDHPLEYLAPFVEIDKVARTWAFLSLKGRTLVRETREEK